MKTAKILDAAGGNNRQQTVTPRHCGYYFNVNQKHCLLKLGEVDKLDLTFKTL